MNEPLLSLANIMVPAVDLEMQDVLKLDAEAGEPFYAMMHYHMGWVDPEFQPLRLNAGKRVRPLICLLSARAAGGDWEQAVPGAASLELLHNFTLIHDDIQDGSPTRRGRPTVWQLWGVNLAINGGDAMFALSHIAMNRMIDHGVPAHIVVRALRRLDETCVDLTIGQHADMSFEEREKVTVDEYLQMINGKTAALLAFSAELGAMVADSSDEQIDHFAAFGRDLGLAFQVRDDILGIWGDETIIGKSAATDIATRKKSLPVLFGLENSPQLNRLYAESETSVDFVDQVVEELERVGARRFTESYEEMYASSALDHLAAASIENQAGQALHQLTLSLLNRHS